MSAGQVLRRLAAAKHVLATHGTIILVLVLEALVRLEDAHGNAHTALVAVAKVFRTADAAKAALLAMEGFLGQGHPEIATAAMVLSEDRLAIYALV